MAYTFVRSSGVKAIGILRISRVLILVCNGVEHESIIYAKHMNVSMREPENSLARSMKMAYGRDSLSYIPLNLDKSWLNRSWTL